MSLVLATGLAASSAPPAIALPVAGITLTPEIIAGLAVFLVCPWLIRSVLQPAGRALTLLTAAVCGGLFAATGFLILWGSLPAVVAPLILAGTGLIVLRGLGLFLLPARGDRAGLREGVYSIMLAAACGSVWWLFDASQAPFAALACLLLSWPYLIDGINAFADKVYHQAAETHGVLGLTEDAFSKIARARDIVIDKAALMSGPDLMVTNVMAFNNEPKTLLAVAASAESGSDHPVATALRHLAEQWQINLKQPDRFDPAPGLGVVALLGGQTVVIGTTDLLKRLKIDSFTADAIARSLEADGKTVLRVAVGGRVVGVLGLEGTLRQDSGVAGRALRSEGLTPWLSTGDSLKTREALANMLGLEVLDDPKPGEMAGEAAHRMLGHADPLVLTLSNDRTRLELRTTKGDHDGASVEIQPIAVSTTDDIGAFPALKALSMRRNLLAVHARRLLSLLWLAAGCCGGALILPAGAAPVVFGMGLIILWGFARFSIADSLRPRAVSA